MSTTAEAIELIVMPDLALVAPSASDAARKQRDRILKAASTLTAVTTPEEAERATNALKVMKSFTATIEVGRKIAKEPVLALGKAVDELAREIAAEVEAEYTRVSRFLGAYEQEQKRIAEEARRKAWEEEQRVIREAREKERAAQLKADEERRVREHAAREEQMRIQRELDSAKSEKAKAKRQAELEAAQAKAAEDERVAKEKAEADRAARDEVAVAKVVEARVSVVTPEKRVGVSVRRNPKFKVTNIQELYEAAPYLVTLEPNTAALNTAIRGLSEGQKIPGIEWWMESAASVR